jgi:DnaJ family protein C protein 8
MSKDPSASNTPAETPAPASEISDADLERLLNREASAIQRELEVERILHAFKLKSVSFLPLHGHCLECLYFTVLLAVHMTF